MAEITNELMYELLKCMHADIGQLKFGQEEMKIEMNAMRGTMVSMHPDIHNLYSILTHQEQRLERIENRLEFRELAEAQARFEPHP